MIDFYFQQNIPRNIPNVSKSNNIPRVDYKLTANELLFFPKQYDPMPVRQKFSVPNDLVRKRNYLEKIQGKQPDEQRKLRANRDARYLHQNAKGSNGALLIRNGEEDEKYFCLEHLVGRCHSTDCGKWHQMRNQRLFGVCKYYLSGVCKNGDLCQFMHEDFPCRYYYLDLEHPKAAGNVNCRLKHGGPLPRRLRQYFRKQIEMWVRDITKNKPMEFDSTLMKFLDLFDEKQTKLEHEYESKNPETTPTLSTSTFSLERILTSTQVKRLAQQNITTAVQMNQIPVDELLDYGLTADQILKITTDTCTGSNPSSISLETIPQDILSNDQLNSFMLSSLETNDNSFHGFSEVEIKDAEEMLKTRQFVLRVDTEIETKEAELEAKCDESVISRQECTLPDDSDDSDNEFNLLINEDEDI